MTLVQSVLLVLLLGATIAACRPERSGGPQLPGSAPAAAPRPSVELTATPAATPELQHQLAMYQAAIDTFFADSQVQRLLLPDLLSRELVSIEPTFFDTKRPIPAEVMQMIRAHTSAEGLVEVQHEQPGGLLIEIGTIGQDPGAATVYPQGGPTIQLSAWISGISCGASVGIGYLLTETDHGWQAQQYVVAVC